MATSRPESLRNGHETALKKDNRSQKANLAVASEGGEKMNKQS